MRTSKNKSKYCIEKKVKSKPSSIDKKTIITIESDKINTFINAANDCRENARIFVSDGCIRYQEVDTGNVYMLIEEAQCNITTVDGSPKQINFNTNALKRALKHSKGTNVTLECSEHEIIVKYGRFTITMPTVDPMHIGKLPNIPDLNLPVSIEVPGKYLSEMCSLITDRAKIFLYIKEKVVFVAASDGDVCFKEVVGTVDKKIAARSLFSNDYFKLIVKSLGSVSMSIDFGVDHPMRATGTVNGCKMQFLLAPRIESD